MNNTTKKIKKKIAKTKFSSQKLNKKQKNIESKIA
jgi:hypothetical protein